jgi:4-hydroxybenzoate polyprenyltransferase
MSALLKTYRYVNILSIDTALGAVISASFIAKLIEADVWIYGKIALGITVWIIYTADHLLDARKVTGVASSERHRFHQKHFRTLATVMVLAVVIDLFVVFFMRESLLYYGLLLSIVVALYLVVSRFLKMLKEVFIALVYTVGVMLPGLGDIRHAMDRLDLLFIFCFFLVAAANLFVFSWYDLNKDRADGHPSFVTYYGREKTKIIVYGLFAACVMVCASLIVCHYPVFPVILLFTMMSILVLILRFENTFAKNDRFRFAGDAVFFIPVVYLILG